MFKKLLVLLVVAVISVAVAACGGFTMDRTKKKR